MRSLILLTVLLLAASLFLPGCGARKGPLVAKVKGLKIYQSALDSVYPEVRDKDQRNERLKEYIKTEVDQQVLYLKARKMKFDRQPENKAILKNIEMIEASNYYNSEIIQKNWGFLEKEVVNAYDADRELYRKEKPKTDSVPTADQKKAVAEYQKDPYKPLDQVRSKVLRKLLLSQPENKKAVAEFMKTLGTPVDSSKITQKEDEIINTHVGDLETRIFEQLKKDHNVEIFVYAPKITDDEIKEEWEKTKNTYKRKPDYQVQHIEVPDEKTARDILDKVNNQNKDFAALQKKYSVNKATKGKTFLIRADEEIKELAGAGDTKAIYPRIMYTPAGKVSTPVGLTPAPGAKGAQHLFKIISVEPEALQSYEEAKQAVRGAIYSRKQIEIPINTIMAKADGKPITAAEIFTLLFKMSPMVSERYHAEEGRKALLEKYYLRFVLYKELAESKGLFSEDALKDRILKSQQTFLVSDFRQNYLDIYFGLSESEALNFWKSNPDSFMGTDKKEKPFDAVRGDVVNRLLVSPKMVEDYYAFNTEDYAENDGAPKALKEVYSTIYYAILSKEKERRSEETLGQYRREFGLKVYRKELDFNVAKTADAIFEETKKLHEDRKYADAQRNYLDLRYRFPKFKGHPDICMALAQIYIEQNQYYKAIQEYKRFMRLYPDSKDKYKAQFMIGFVYSENLKDKDKAISSYQGVLDNYPGCDLVESAKFMIEHLKSGKDDFAFLNDSTGVADSSATAAGVKKPAEAPKVQVKKAETKKAEAPKAAAEKKPEAKKAAEPKKK